MCIAMLYNKVMGRKPRKKRGQTKRCIYCKQSYYVPSYRVNSAKYCSRSCLAKVHLPKFSKIYGFKKQNKPLHKYEEMTINGKKVRVHRFVMEQFLKRKLETWEHVHHIDGNSLNNDLKNLIVLSNSDHQKNHLKERTNSSVS